VRARVCARACVHVRVFTYTKHKIFKCKNSKYKREMEDYMILLLNNKQNI